MKYQQMHGMGMMRVSLLQCKIDEVLFQETKMDQDIMGTTAHMCS